MAERTEIKINGKEYPCEATLGALLRFKEETGKEVTQMNDGNIADIATYIWCCVKSACSKEHIAFDLSLQDFADNIDMNEANRLAMAIGASNGDAPSSGNQKKSRPQS